MKRSVMKRKERVERVGRGGRPPARPLATGPPVEGVTAPKPLPQISPSDAAKLRRGKL